MKVMTGKWKIAKANARTNIMEVTKQIYGQDLDDTQRAIRAIRSVSSGKPLGKKQKTQELKCQALATS